MSGVDESDQAGRLEINRSQSEDTQQPRLSMRSVLIVFAAAVVICGVGFEVGARLFWRSSYNLRFSETDRVLYSYYPGLRTVDREAPRADDRNINILILGGSVIAPDFSPFAEYLIDELTDAGYRNVRINNLAAPAHTSRDSLHKYRAMGDARFDLVIFYHGINEARVNNIPPEHFRDDYSHYYWYETVNAIAPEHGVARLATPYTLRLMAIRLRQVLNMDKYIRTHDPNPYWMQLGENIKSSDSFDQNFVDILELAGSRGDRILPVTFATYFPADYSLEGFEDRSLDYGFGSLSFPIEVWGRPENVKKAVDAHNEIIRQRSAERGVEFVDLARMMNPSGENFYDVCHLSRTGTAIMAAAVGAGIGPK